MSKTAWVPFEQLRAFMIDLFKSIGVPKPDAKTCADVLIQSDADPDA